MTYVDLSKTSWRPNAFVAAQFRRAGVLRGLGCMGLGGLSFATPPMRPVPVPRGLPQGKLKFAAGNPVADMLRGRDAMANRLRVFPDYRVLTQEEARAAIDAAQAAIDPKRAEIDAYLATMSASDPVPESINFTMSRQEAQSLILGYMWYASAGSQVYEDGTANAMVQSGIWDQSFVDGDIATRNSILDTLAKWDTEGFIDRAFGTPAGAAGLGAIQIGVAIGVAVVVAAVILAGTYYLVTTTNFAKEQELRLAHQQKNCADIRAANTNQEAIKACNDALKNPPSVAEVQAEAAKSIAYIAIGGLLIYALVVYGAPHWLDVYDSRDRRIRGGG